MVIPKAGVLTNPPTSMDLQEKGHLCGRAPTEVTDSIILQSSIALTKGPRLPDKGFCFQEIILPFPGIFSASGELDEV